MLTEYTPVPYNSNPASWGYKAFVFGVPAPRVLDKWIESTKGPGFHVFIERAAAERYIEGVKFGVVGNDPAVTAKWLLIPSSDLV